MNALLSEFLVRLSQFVRADAAGVFSRQGGTWRAEPVTGVLVGHPGAYRVYPQGMIEQAVQRAAPVRLREVTIGTELRTVLDSLGVRDVLAVPLQARHHVLGAVVLLALAEDTFTAEAVVATRSMAEAITAVVLRRDAPELASLSQQSAVDENELRFRAFMAALPANAWVKDDRGSYLFANQRVNDLLRGGRSVLGLTDFDLMPEAMARAVRADDERVREGAMVLNREEDLPTPDGAEHTWLTTRFPIVESSGRVTIGGFALDITQKKQAEREAAAATHELEHVVDLLSDPVTITRDGVLVYANEAMGQMLGLAARSLIGRDVRDFIDPVDLTAFEADLRALEAGQPYTAERRGRRADGARILIEVTARRITLGGVPSLLAVLRDVTQRRASSQRLQLTDRLASIGTLAAGVAHEINNPLSYVLANLSLLAERVPPSSPDELFELTIEARDGAERIKRIVEGMRTLARPADPHRRAMVSLEKAVQQAIDLTANEVKHRARLEVSLGSLPRVLGDETALVQVFVNLLTNAAQAIPPGVEDRHVVRVAARTLPDGRAQVSVQDDGVGMTREVLARIFDPFFTTKPVNSGTGLGLTVSHAIIGAHGGELTVESTPGRGSTFLATLPAGEGQQQTASMMPGRARILVVDDDELVARSISRVLNTHEVTVALSAQAALEALTAREFDLVLCDVMMPGMDGPTLQARVPPTTAARFVFITGGAFTPEAQAFLDRVANPVLTKPLDRKRLAALAAEAARARDAPRGDAEVRT